MPVISIKIARFGSKFGKVNVFLFVFDDRIKKPGRVTERVNGPVHVWAMAV
jgi:hypothetical protein